MIAIIETGGKQYLVKPGDVFKVEKVKNFKDKKIVFDKVLLLDDGKEIKIGMPYLASAKVQAEVVEEGKLPKVTVIKYRAKSRYFKKRGHRQPYFKVKIISIS